MLDGIASKIVHKDKGGGSIQEKKSKALSEAKLVKYINKNPQSFLEINLMQKEVPPPGKLRDHAYD